MSDKSDEKKPNRFSHIDLKLPISLGECEDPGAEVFTSEPIFVTPAEYAKLFAPISPKNPYETVESIPQNEEEMAKIMKRLENIIFQNLKETETKITRKFARDQETINILHFGAEDK